MKTMMREKIFDTIELLFVSKTMNSFFISTNMKLGEEIECREGASCRGGMNMMHVEDGEEKRKTSFRIMHIFSDNSSTVCA